MVKKVTFLGFRGGRPNRLPWSTVPDLSCVVIRKWHRENREVISIVKPHFNKLACILAGSLYFGVCDVI